MRKSICFSLLIILTFVSLATGSDPSPKTHYYLAEYRRPVKGSGNVGFLAVVFYDKISSKQAEDFLRSELERAMTLHSPGGDILAKAIYSTGDALSESVIKLTDGSNSLVYDSKTKKVVTSIQLWGTNVPPLIPKK